MVVIISHPTEELNLIRLQKELIKKINDDNSIWYRQVPLWIELSDKIINTATNGIATSITTTSGLKLLSSQIENITLTRPVISSDSNMIYLPVQVKTKKEVLNAELPLLYRLKGSKPADLTDVQFSEMTLKQCQFAVASKLHDAGTAVQGCKTSSYVLQDSVWFKQAK